MRLSRYRAKFKNYVLNWSCKRLKFHWFCSHLICGEPLCRGIGIAESVKNGRLRLARAVIQGVASICRSIDPPHGASDGILVARIQSRTKLEGNMAIKPAKQKLQELNEYLPNLKKAIQQFEDMRTRLEQDEAFCKLWETDSAAALRAVGINSDARMEMGLPPYDDAERGPRCDWCVTPKGNACHC
jgi:hypothetical protein